MTDDDALLRELVEARKRREACALTTVAATRGSVPRHAGAKMLVYADGRSSGTVGGGKFEALVIEECRAALDSRTKEPLLKTYPLYEGTEESFGAVCGGEATVFIEPQVLGEALFIVGGGHCSRAIAKLAVECGWHVTVIEDRAELMDDIAANEKAIAAAPEFVAGRAWHADEALVLVSRNVLIDQESLHAALRQGGMGYLGMMGSKRKVRMVFDEMMARGIPAEQLAKVFAPIGLNIGSDTPAEIAVSVMAQVFQAMRGATGGNMPL